MHQSIESKNSNTLNPKPKTRRISFAEVPVCVLAFSSTGTTQQGTTIDVFVSQNHGRPPSGEFVTFETDESVRYDALKDDFGPINMIGVMRFAEILESEIANCCESGTRQLLYVASKGQRALTNAVFLVGAYLILKLGESPHALAERLLREIDRPLMEEYCDVSSPPSNFRLSVIDCWQGLAKGIGLEWISVPEDLSKADRWGKIHRELHRLYSDPLNADLHELVPGKFVAFRGPRDLNGQLYRDNKQSRTREFDPSYFLDIFDDLHVSTVIRLNEALYDGKIFKNHGIEHHELYFEDCTAPRTHIIQKFFEIADRAKGMVAVHCKAGLGRTGALIALYLMRTYGFTAREAIGWLRIMRPGSVIGRQQDFLCMMEGQMREGNILLQAECQSAQSTSRSEFGMLRSLPDVNMTAILPGRSKLTSAPALCSSGLKRLNSQADRLRALGNDSSTREAEDIPCASRGDRARRESIAVEPANHKVSRRPRPPSLSSVVQGFTDCH